jgi:hypothetical protein
MIKKTIFQLYTRNLAAKQKRLNRQTVLAQTEPGHIFFAAQLKQFLRCDDEWLHQTAQEYAENRAAWENLSGWQSSSRRTDGVAKSLDVAEGFAVWALVKHLRPPVVVELGVQYGVSSRLWKEALKRYVLAHELVLCDLEDKRRFISNDECTFLQADARTVLPDLFASGQVGILHNDAHPYDLIKWSVQMGLEHQVPVFTFHDVGRGPRGPFKRSSYALSSNLKMQHNVNWSEYGHWERHVMAELFDETILDRDSVENSHYRLHLFDSLFGLGVVQRV